MVNMASSMDPGRARPTTMTTRSRYMAAILKLTPSFTAYVLDIWSPGYGQLTPVKTRYSLTGIT